MNVFLIILALASIVLSVLLITKRIQSLRRIAELAQQCERAEVEKAQLKQALSYRDSKEAERFERLEHDLRSSIGVTVGLSSLLKETLENDSERQSMSVLKSANAIHQSATRTLKVIDAASGAHAQQRSENS